MARSVPIIEKGLKAALSIAAMKPWADITLSEIAIEAKLKLSDFHGLADKDQLGDASDAFFDAAMSAEAADLEDSPVERLFDVIMLRFEAMEPYRDGLLTWMRHRETSPARIAQLLKARRASAEWALASAGLDDSKAAPKTLKAVNVAIAIGLAERAWRKETSGDFALTMAALDKQLKNAEDRLSWWSRFTGRGTGEASEHEETSEVAEGEILDAPNEDSA